MPKKCCKTNIPKGTIIDRYVVKKHIHDKAVYFATELGTGKEFVLKRGSSIDFLDKNDPRKVGKMVMQYEAYAQSRAAHPNVCPAGRVIDDGNKFYLVTPNIGPKNFYHYVKYDKPASEDKLLILEDVANALVHCHEKDVLHLDVKERNVIVKDKKGILVDFGAARIWDSPHHIVDKIVSYTPDAAAPEHARRKNSTFSPRSDTFSFSYMTFWALTGHAAYRKETHPMYAISQHHPLSLAQFNGFGDLVIKGLSIDPEKRPPIKELADAVKEQTARYRRQQNEAISALFPASSDSALLPKREPAQYTAASYAAGQQPQPAPLS